MNRTKGTIMAFLAAALYALSAPLSKILLDDIGPVFMASFLYLGAGLDSALLLLSQKDKSKEQMLERKDTIYTVMMVVLDILAPVALMFGLRYSNASTTSLLNNFEIAATSLIALLLFKEKISKRLWAAIILVMISSIILTFDPSDKLVFSTGSALVLLASVLWGFENNCTRSISDKNPIQIVTIKGIGSGLGAFILALNAKEALPKISAVIPALTLGFVSYGLSITCYIYAQRMLGAARTSTYYAVAPFIGTTLSLLILKERPGLSFFVALAIMAIGTYLATERE